MKMKFKIKYIALLIVFFTFGTLISTPFHVKASDSMYTEIKTGEINSPTNTISNNIDSKFMNKIAEYATVETNGDTTTAFISDIDVAKIENQLYGTPIDKSILLRKSGNTKIVFHGKARKGNVDIYLSASMLNKLKKGSINGDITVVAGLLATAAGATGLGVAWGVINYAIKKLMTEALYNNISHFKAGRIFKIRNWKYAGWSYQ